MGKVNDKVPVSEFQLLADCCRCAFAAADRQTSFELPAQLDADLFLRLARFHGVEGLVWRSLGHRAAALPNGIADTLSISARDIAIANLRAARASEQLLRCFEGERIDLLFVKGLSLGRLAYGDAAVKAAIDVDLLVARDQLELVAPLLLQCGYRRVIPHPDKSLPRWHDGHKESVWLNDAEGIQIDLHTRLSDNPALIPSVGMGSPRQMVEVANGISLPTLDADTLFAYLAVHGASSAWFRLKWISDFAGCIAGLPADEMEQRYRASQQLRAGRAPGQALLLADDLFGSLAEAPVLRAELERNSGHRRLFRAALRQLAGRAEPAEPTEKRLGTVRIHATQLLLLPGLGFKISESWRQLKAALG
jgi:hypothetical protein